jgi:hypothetical protein
MRRWCEVEQPGMGFRTCGELVSFISQWLGREVGKGEEGHVITQVEEQGESILS